MVVPPSLRRVCVPRTPAGLVVRADEYLLGLMRELELLRLGRRAGLTPPQPAEELLEAMEHILLRMGPKRLVARDTAEHALQRGISHVDIALDLLLDAADDVAALLAIYDEVVRCAADLKLLMPPPDPEVAAFQREWLRELERQLRHDVAPAALKGVVAGDHPERRAVPRPARAAAAAPGPDMVELRLEPTLEAPRYARILLHALQQRWPMEELYTLAELPLSELVTNAVMHARTAIEVAVCVRDQTLRCEVRDGVTELPASATHDVEAATGRGLALVAAMVNRWGIAQHGGGKVVWFELDRAADGRGSLTDGAAAS